MTSVTIGSGMSYIGMGAFTDCKKLSIVYYVGNSTSWNAITIIYDSVLTKATRIYI